MLKVLACCVLVYEIAMAQPSQREYWGVLGGWSYLWHQSAIPVFEGQRECGQFTTGRSQGLLSALRYDRQIVPWLSATAQVSYWHRPAQLTMRTDNGLQAFDPDAQAYVPFIREHVYTAQLRYLGVEIAARLYPLRFLELDLPIWARIGADVAYPAVGATYVQTEEIIQPRSLLFPDGLKRHVLQQGTVPQVATSLGLIVAVGLDIPLRDRIELVPEVGIRYGIGSVRSDVSWRIDAIYTAIGVRVDVGERPAPILPPEPEPPPPQPKPTPTIVISPVSPEPVRVQSAIVTETFPLLPYVFFDSASTTVPSRYLPTVQPTVLSVAMLPRSTLEIYYYLLPILGRRLQSDTSLVLTITGTTDGVELPRAQQLQLARGRAEAVAAYFQSVCGIPSRQLVLRTSSTPGIPSNPAYLEGIAENRRVELSGSPELFAPIIHERFREYVVRHRRIVFQCGVEGRDLITRWHLRVLWRDTQVGHYAGTQAPPSLLSIELDSSKLIAIAPDIAPNDSLLCDLLLTTRDGEELRRQLVVPLEHVQSKFERSRLSLVVFDFDRADLPETNQELVRRFVLQAITPHSSVRITGTTDRLGEEGYNQRLSQARAEYVQNFILSLLPTARIEEVRGLGSSRLLYDNALPEGRYYCRTVTILVETPLYQSP